MKPPTKKDQPLGKAMRTIKAGEPLTTKNFQPYDQDTWVLIEGVYWRKL